MLVGLRRHGGRDDVLVVSHPAQAAVHRGLTLGSGTAALLVRLEKREACRPLRQTSSHCEGFPPAGDHGSSGVSGLIGFHSRSGTEGKGERGGDREEDEAGDKV